MTATQTGSDAEAGGSTDSGTSAGSEDPEQPDLSGANASVTRTEVPTLRFRGQQEPDRAALRSRAQELGVHPLLVRLLTARGIESAGEQKKAMASRLSDLRRPDEMAGFVPALELLLEARRKGWRVGVFGDYDVDGVTTATILTTYMEAIGLEVVAAVAHRERGYGLGIADAQAFVDAGVQLVVTGDVGTSDVEALQWLRDRELKTIVIDHHQVPQTQPPTDAFINPHQAGCRFPFKGLCSAGVAFYLCAALRTELSRAGVQPLPDPRAWLDLVAVATVCDMMPLREENRVLVRNGLRQLAARRRPGLAALLASAGVEAEVTPDEEHIGYKLGPRLNAPGRLGSAEPSLRLLRARSDAEAQPLAEHIEVLNDRRKRHSRAAEAEALAILAADAKERAGIVVAHDGWLPGIVGIAASGLSERFGRPVLCLAIDNDQGVARGSVRTAGGVDVRAALAECAALLERYGGHREAAGVTLQAHNVDALTEAFDVAVGAQLAGGHGDEVDVEDVDCTLPTRLVDPALVEALGTLGPYGVGFAPPRFLIEGMRVERVRVMAERHLSLTLCRERVRHEAIAFGQAFHGLELGDFVDCIYVPGLDEFRGVARLRLRIERMWRSPNL